MKKCSPFQVFSVFLPITEDVDSQALCTVKLSEKDLQAIKDAIEDLYYFEFVLGRYFDISF